MAFPAFAAITGWAREAKAGRPTPAPTPRRNCLRFEMLMRSITLLETTRGLEIQSGRRFPTFPLGFRVWPRFLHHFGQAFGVADEVILLILGHSANGGNQAELRVIQRRPPDRCQRSPTRYSPPAEDKFRRTPFKPPFEPGSSRAPAAALAVDSVRTQESAPPNDVLHPPPLRRAGTQTRSSSTTPPDCPTRATNQPPTESCSSTTDAGPVRRFHAAPTPPTRAEPDKPFDSFRV